MLGLARPKGLPTILSTDDIAGLDGRCETEEEDQLSKAAFQRLVSESGGSEPDHDPCDEASVVSAAGSTHDHVGGRFRAASEGTSESSYGSTQASSRLAYPEPGQTLIILDWDDTLFPTSSLMNGWNVPSWQWHAHPDYPLHLPPGLEVELEHWRRTVYEYLSASCSLSDRVVIVTNATRPWVDTCIRRFAPNLRPLFCKDEGRCTVVYADEALKEEREEKKEAIRTEHAGRCLAGCIAGLQHWWQNLDSDLDDEQKARLLTDAKKAAMKREAAKFYSKYNGQTWKNIFSMGDMKYEYVALHELSLNRVAVPRERLRTKAVIVPPHAAVNELTLNLRVLTLLLPAIVHFDGKIDLDLRSEDPVAAMADALHMPGLEHVPLPRYAWGIAPPPKDMDEVVHVLDELAVLVHEHVATIKEVIRITRDASHVTRGTPIA